MSFIFLLKLDVKKKKKKNLLKGSTLSFTEHMRLYLYYSHCGGKHLPSFTLWGPHRHKLS